MLDYKAVIFDMDGTLLDSEALAKNFWRTALESHGLEVEESFLDGMLGRSQQAVRESIKCIYGENVPYDYLKDRKLSEELKYYNSNPLPFKSGAIEILSYFKKQESLPIALATSTERSRTDFRLNKGNLGKYFDYTLCGDEVVNPKPDPEMYLKVCSALGQEPSAVLVFEDSPSGVEAAVNAGTKVVWIRDIVEIPKTLQDKIWKNLNSLNEFVVT